MACINIKDETFSWFLQTFTEYDELYIHWLVQGRVLKVQMMCGHSFLHSFRSCLKQFWLDYTLNPSKKCKKVGLVSDKNTYVNIYVTSGSGKVTLTVSSLPHTPAVRVVSFREELPQWFVHYHHCNRQRGSRLKMAPSPIGHCVLLLLWGLGLSWTGRGGLNWKGIDRYIEDRSLYFYTFFFK